jgi:phage terminase small subunit
MRGRRLKPTRMKVLTGNPGKRPMNRYKPKPEPAVPECPNELGPVARREWDWLASELGKLKILTVLDCQSSGRNHDAHCVGIWLHAGEQEQDFDADQKRAEFV